MKTIIPMLLLLLAAGCSSKKKVSSERVTEYKALVIRDTTLPGWNFRATLPSVELQNLVPGQVITIRDTAADGSLRGKVRIWMDAYGNLMAECDQKDQTIQALRREVESQSSHSETTKTVTKRPWLYSAVVLAFAFLIGGAVAILIRLR